MAKMSGEGTLYAVAIVVVLILVVYYVASSLSPGGGPKITTAGIGISTTTIPSPSPAAVEEGASIDFAPFSKTLGVFKKKTSLGRTFTADAVATAVSGTVTSAVASGRVELDNELSYARIILEDASGKQYLVFASDSLSLGAGKYKFKDSCEETCDMPPITPKRIIVSVSNARLFINDVSFENEVAQGVSESELKERAQNKKNAQFNERIKLINDRNAFYGDEWTAGNTSVASMSFDDKRKLFTDWKLPNLYGFDAYAGGIFSLPPADRGVGGGGKGKKPKPTPSPLPVTTTTTRASTTTTTRTPTTTTTTTTVPVGILPTQFDWRNRHGENWITSVKDQGGCGSCWAFDAAGTIEGVINEYYNQHYEIDLSEQDIVACAGCGSCAGGSPSCAVNYAKNTGLVDEACFKYNFGNLNCSLKCSDWASRVWKVGGSESGIHLNKQDIMDRLYHSGSLSLIVLSWNHAITAVGYGTSPVNGKFYVIFKNSWGTYYGVNGFGNMEVAFDANSLSSDMTFARVFPPFTPPLANFSTVACVDKDADGFCNWGIGSKPANCPANCSSKEDFDDSNPAINDTPPSCIAVKDSPRVSLSALSKNNVTECDRNSVYLNEISLVPYILYRSATCGYAGQTVEYAATVTSYDDISCSPSTFEVQINPALPAGWTLDMSPTTFTLAPGKSQVVSIRLTHPSGAGYYAFYVSVYNVNNRNRNATSSYTAANIWPQTCNYRTPAVWMRPIAQYGTAGSTLNYKLITMSLDNRFCNSTVLNIAQASLPTGFTQTLSGTSLTLNSEASGSVDVAVTSPTGAGKGNYTISENVSNSRAPSLRKTVASNYSIK